MSKVPRVFFSYVRQVDVHDQQRLTMLRERLEGELRVLTGEPVEIFQDIRDIGWGEDWRRRLEDAIDESLFLLPVLTEGYFKSQHCRDELEAFAARERMLGRDDLILPLLYTPCPSLRRTRHDAVIALVKGRNYEDWVEQRHEDPRSSSYNRAVTRLAERLIEAIDRLDEAAQPRTSRDPSVGPIASGVPQRTIEATATEAPTASEPELLNRKTRTTKEPEASTQLNTEPRTAEEMLRLALSYINGDGVEKDHQKAFEWYRKSAEKGNAEGMFYLGWCFGHGQGVEKDHQKALEWYRKSAEAGSSAAMYNLGVYYDTGRGVVEPDSKTAFKWYHKSAETGNSIAMHILATAYHEGESVKQDYQVALEWYLKGAKAGHADSMNALGELYRHGEGVEQDERKAVEWYYMGAKAGSPIAMCNLGEMYFEGHGIEHNDEVAVKWWRKAADANVARAMNWLGIAHRDRRGVILQDQRKAVSWFRQGANRGDTNAMRNLAWHLANGVGVTKDQNEAAVWYLKAIKAGNKAARRDLFVLRMSRYTTFVLLIVVVSLGTLAIIKMFDTP